MIQINDIHITNDAFNLIIDAQVIGDSESINHIYIDTQDSFLTTGPSEDVVYEQDITEENVSDECNAVKIIDEHTFIRKIRLSIPQEAICASLKNNFFIVYLEDDEGKLTTTTVFWHKPLYNSFLRWIREIGYKCEIPRNFIYLFLQYQALITAVRTCNILEAIKIYNKYFHNINMIGVSKGCGCKK